MSQTPPTPYSHGTPKKTGVLLINLGTPDAPEPGAVRRYLAEFLSDRRVVEIPRLLWWPILHGIILRLRPKASAHKYALIWSPEGSPLRVWTDKLSRLLLGFLGERGHQVDVRWAMRYGPQRVPEVLQAMRRDGVERILVLPLYPQYCAATTASAMDAVFEWGRQARWLPALRSVSQFCDDPGYIDALAHGVRQHWHKHGRGQKLVISFHGMPERSLHLGDPYHCHCHKTARLLAQALQLGSEDYLVCFQSRFGRAKWLQPYTEPTLIALARQGLKHVDIICPAFVADCVETLEEIDIGAKQAFIQAGGQQLSRVPCLNDDLTWVRALTSLVEQQLQGWPTQAGEHDAAASKLSLELALAKGAKR